MSTFTSFWRCDMDGESFAVNISPVELDEDGEIVGSLHGDVLIERPMPCPICGGDMRRTQGLLDQRDWGHDLQ